MGFKKDKESKVRAILDAIKQKYLKNTEPFANKEEMKGAFDNLVNSAHQHINTDTFSNNTYETTLMEEAEAFGKRMPTLKKKV